MHEFSDLGSNVPKKKPVKENDLITKEPEVETSKPDLLSSSDEDDDWAKIKKRHKETTKSFDDLFNDNKNVDISDKKDSSDNKKNEIDSFKRQLDEIKKELQNVTEEQKSEQNDFHEKMVANNAKIKALEDSKAKLQKLRQLAATKLDETKKELQNMTEEQKSKQKDFQEKMVAQNAKIKALEGSKAKLQKLKQLLATTIFLANAKGENLESLLKLEIEDLFSKYDQSIIVKNSYKDKYEETIETLSEVKTKLQLQMQQKELYEKQHNEMMDILNIPEENRGFASILPAIQHLKSSLSVIQEQAETNHYTNAQTQIGSIL